MENETLILNKLDMLKAEVNLIREHIEDITLTQEDLDSLVDAEKDLKEGKTKRLE
jgi:riboflavin synthase alpha subunit|tara:strand:+ start:126 stop:290 length:165 start_codon:yes stop_codon:yes gene_type:complete